MTNKDTEMQELNKNEEDADKALILKDDELPEKDTGSKSDSSEFTGLSKEEVMKYANDPKWKKIRMVIFILFWVLWFAMFIVAIVIIITSEKCPAKPPLKWYQKSGVYEIVVPSFYDSDKNGIGDINGVSEKMDYLSKFGGSAITLWLSGITKTKNDFKKSTNPVDMLYMPTETMIAPQVGTDKDFKSLVAKCNERKRVLKPKLIVDLFPLWRAVKSETTSDEDKQDYVVSVNAKPGATDKCEAVPDKADFCDSDLGNGKKVKGVMVNDRCMPLLDLTKESVQKKVLESVSYWKNLGSNGFMVHGAEFLHMPFVAAGKPCDGPKFLAALKEKAGDLAMLTRSSDSKTSGWLRKVLGIDMVALQMKSWKKEADCCGGQVIGQFSDWLGSLKKADKSKSDAYVVTSLAMQFGDGATRRAADLSDKPFSLHALSLLASVTPITLYGEELGLSSMVSDYTNTSLESAAGEDKTAMGSLVSMPWSQAKKGGFTMNTSFSWMPQAKDVLKINVQASEALGSSSASLKSYRALMELRKDPAFQYGSLKILKRQRSVLAFVRNPPSLPRMVVAINFGPTAFTVDFSDMMIPTEGEVKFSTANVGSGTVKFASLFMKPGDVAVFQVAREEPE